MEKSAVAPASQELPSSGSGVSAEADKSRGFTGRPHGAKAETPGLHMRLDDALQRALEHPKYRMTALRFEEAFIEFIESGEQRMVIDESLTGFGKCIAHRVAKLYGLETLTVSNSDNTPSVGVRRTRKSVHIPQVKLRDLYAIRHPWAPEEPKQQAQPSAGAAGLPEPSSAVPQPALSPATAPPASRNNPDAPSGAAPAAVLASQTCQCPTAPMEPITGAPQESVSQSRVSGGATPQHPTVASSPGNPADTEGILPGPLAVTEAAAGQDNPLKSLQPSKVGPKPESIVNDSLTDLRPERDSQQKGQMSLKQRVGSSEDQMSHERGMQPAHFLPSASESLSQSGGSSVLHGFTAGPSSHTRSSDAQESSQPASHAVTPITSGESLAASRSDRSEGSQMYGDPTSGFRDTRRRRGSAGRFDKAGGPFLARGIPAGQDMARDMPILEGQGKVMMPGGPHASLGTRSPVSSMAGQRAGSRKGRQGALDRGSDFSNLHPREALGSYTRGREQMHMSEWRGDQSQGRHGRPELAQAAPDVPPSPFSKDPRAAPSQSILEQQMSQRLSLDPGHQVKAQLAMSEPLYRPHGQQSNMATLPALPPASSGTVAAPHQPGFLSPLLPSAPGQLPGAHPPYGAFGTPLAIPPGYMLVRAPGAVQGMPMYQPPLQPYPIPGHPGYYYLPPGSAPPLPEGHMGYHSAQHGLTWDPHGTPYSHNPRPSMQGAAMHIPSHARLPPGMAHQYMAAPPMWPAQAAVRLPSQQQPNVAEAAQHTQHYQQWQAEQQWPPPSQRQNRQQPAVSAPSTARSGNLLRQPSGEQTSRRSQNSRQQPRQQP